MRWVWFAASLLVAASAGARTIVLTNANVIDGISDAPAMGRAVVIRDGRIAAVVSAPEGDLIVVDQSPLENILSLQDVLMVVNNGKVVLDRLSFALE